MRDRLVDIRPASQRVGQVAMSLGIIGGGGDCRLKLGDRLADFALSGQFGAAEVLGFGIAAAGFSASLVIPGGLARLSLLRSN